MRLELLSRRLPGGCLIRARPTDLVVEVPLASAQGYLHLPRRARHGHSSCIAPKTRRRRRLRRRKPRRECDTDTLRAVLANARPNRPTLAHAGAPLSNAQSVARRRPTHEPWPLPPVVAGTYPSLGQAWAKGHKPRVPQVLCPRACHTFPMPLRYQVQDNGRTGIPLRRYRGDHELLGTGQCRRLAKVLPAHCQDNGTAAEVPDLLSD